MIWNGNPLPQSLAKAWKPDGFEASFTANRGRFARWVSSDGEKTYEPKGNRYKVEDFGYRLNERGFRCDDFDTLPRAKRQRGEPLRIVFMGCSNTFGVGLPEDEVWASRVHRHFVTATLTSLPYWNVSEGGRGSSWIVRQAVQVVDLLRPDVIVALLPSAHRRELWVKGQIGAFVHSNADIFPRRTAEAVAELFPPQQEFLEFCRDLALMSAVCTASGVRLIWDTWDRVSFDANRTLPALPQAAVEAWRDFDFCHSREFGAARDKLHCGPLAHEHCAQAVIRHLNPILSVLG